MARKGTKGCPAAIGAMTDGRWQRFYRVLNWHDSHHLRWESQRDHIAEMGDDMMPTRRQRKAQLKASRSGLRFRGCLFSDRSVELHIQWLEGLWK